MQRNGLVVRVCERSHQRSGESQREPSKAGKRRVADWQADCKQPSAESLASSGSWIDGGAEPYLFRSKLLPSAKTRFYIS